MGQLPRARRSRCLGAGGSAHGVQLRKLFARLDATALDLQLALFAWWRTRVVAGRGVIAIDGKTLRGARTGQAATPHLIAALDHATGAVLGQQATAEKSNEIPTVRELISGFDSNDVKGAVITVDAMHTQIDTAQRILDAGADDVFTVKGNQPRLRAQLKDLPWKEVGATTSRQSGHGRAVRWSIKVLQKPSWIAFAGTQQVAQLRRTRTINGEKTTEVVYVITSASFEQAPPGVLAGFVRGHWAIENQLHWVRDVTFDEDRSQVRTGSSPQVIASLRNTATTPCRLAGHSNIAAALRKHSYHPSGTSQWLLTC